MHMHVFAPGYCICCPANRLTIFDHHFTFSYVLEGDLVAERNVTFSLEFNDAIILHDPASYPFASLDIRYGYAYGIRLGVYKKLFHCVKFPLSQVYEVSGNTTSIVGLAKLTCQGTMRKDGEIVAWPKEEIFFIWI